MVAASILQQLKALNIFWKLWTHENMYLFSANQIHEDNKFGAVKVVNDVAYKLHEENFREKISS